MFVWLAEQGLSELEALSQITRSAKVKRYFYPRWEIRTDNSST
jgi:hypothetical protein